MSEVPLHEGGAHPHGDASVKAVPPHVVLQQAQLPSECRGTSLMRNSPPPLDHYRTLGIVLL